MYKGILVGLGQIGMEYDLRQRGCVLTHAKALSQHPEFEFCGGIDLDKEKTELLEEFYSVRGFQTIQESAVYGPDIVTIATPEHRHLSVVTEVLEHCSPRVILCEKPLADKLESAREIIELTNNRGIKLVVNYIRRFEPGAIEVRKTIHNGLLGKNINGVARYSGGLISNGSHAVNLLECWLGQVRHVQRMVYHKKQQELDSDLILEFDKGNMLLLNNKNSSYVLFEIDILGSEGRIQYRNRGNQIAWWNIEVDNRFPNLSMLSPKPKRIESDFFNYQWHVYDHIAKFMSNSNHPLPCAGEDAYATLKIVLDD